MFDAAAHLRKLYNRLGDDVTPLVGTTFKGLPSHEGAAAFELASVPRTTLRYIAADAADLVEGSVVTVGGVQWRCAEDPEPIGDGLEVTVPLQRA